MTRIDTLTPEQKALLPVIRDEWIAIGSSTEPANRPAAEAGVRLAYEIAGLTPPTAFVWRRSPLEGATEAARVVRGGGTPTQSEIRDQLGRSLWGQHDAGWLAWASVWEAFGVTGQARGLAAVARNAGWWWAFDTVAILTERPIALHRDERGRLHCETGPAIVYPDGFGVHSWHGVRVPADVITTPIDEITIERIRAERNAEVRRVLIERIGAVRYATIAGEVKIGTDDWGTLWRADREDDTPIVTVEVVNSTPEPDGTAKTYRLRVHSAFGGSGKTATVDLVTMGEHGEVRRRTETVPRTPHAAIASTFGLTPDEYPAWMAVS